MSRPPLLVPKLRKKARERLERAARKTSCAKFRDRCRAILWSSEEQLSCSEIARRLGVHLTTVLLWVKDYIRFGFKGLKIGKSPGRPPKMDDEAKAALEYALDHHPRDLGYSLAVWTLAALQDFLRQEIHVSVHIETVRATIKKMGYRHKRPKLSLKHKQNGKDMRRARRERDAALKKASPSRIDTPLSIKTNASSTSTPA